MNFCFANDFWPDDGIATPAEQENKEKKKENEVGSNNRLTLDTGGGPTCVRLLRDRS